MHRLRGVETRRHKILKPALDAWLGAVERYCREIPGDSPWWYTERAAVSSFAGGIWAKKGLALEEYSTYRGFGKDKHPGRADLYFRLGEAEFILEAKYEGTSMERHNRGEWKRVRDDLKSARTLVSRNWDGIPGLGAVFVMPCLQRTRIAEFGRFSENWIQSLLAQDPLAAVAWTFPNSARFNSGSGKHRKWIYPGIGLLLRPPRA